MGSISLAVDPCTEGGKVMPFLGKDEKKIAKDMFEKGYNYVFFSEDAAPLYTKTAEQASEVYRESEDAEFNFLPRIMKIEDFLDGEPIPPAILKYQSTGPGKFEGSGGGNLGAWLYAMWGEGRADDDIGDEYFGAYGLFLFAEPVIVRETTGEWEFKGAILYEDDQGFVDVSTYDTKLETQEAWSKLEGEYDEFMEEQEEEEEEY
jgi:hypothetical protein